jgi:hypothetical protein
MQITLTTDGTDLYVTFSRELIDSEQLCLMSRGSSKYHSRKKGLYYDSRADKYYNRSNKRKWHYNFTRDEESKITTLGDKLSDGSRKVEITAINPTNIYKGGTQSHKVLYIGKTSISTLVLPLEDGIQGFINYGFAVYRAPFKDGNRSGKPYRMSNVVNFKRYAKVTDASNYKFDTWYEV